MEFLLAHIYKGRNVEILKEIDILMEIWVMIKRLGNVPEKAKLLNV